MVPAGYMIDANADGLSLVICGSGIYAAAAHSAQQKNNKHAHHHQGTGNHQDTGGESAGADHSICPFAIAATGASATVIPALDAAPATVIDRIAAPSAVAFSSFGPSRAQQSRAPPSFS
jgi:hypothetical protein